MKTREEIRRRRAALECVLFFGCIGVAAALPSILDVLGL